MRNGPNFSTTCCERGWHCAAPSVIRRQRGSGACSILAGDDRLLRHILTGGCTQDSRGGNRRRACIGGGPVGAVFRRAPIPSYGAIQRRHHTFGNTEHRLREQAVQLGAGRSVLKRIIAVGDGALFGAERLGLFDVGVGDMR